MSLFELKRLNVILQEGKTLVSLKGFKEMDNHQDQFIKVAEELLKDLEEIIP